MNNSEQFNIYAAGFFDGEGTVTLSKLSSNNNFRAPVVSISSTTLSILENFKQIYGGSISCHKKYKKHHKQSWSWKLTNNSAITFLKNIFPHMREPEKLRRANLIITEYKLLTPRNGKYSPEQISAKLDFQNRFFVNHPSIP